MQCNDGNEMCLSHIDKLQRIKVMKFPNQIDFTDSYLQFDKFKAKF